MVRGTGKLAWEGSFAHNAKRAHSAACRVNTDMSGAAASPLPFISVGWSCVLRGSCSWPDVLDNEAAVAMRNLVNTVYRTLEIRPVVFAGEQGHSKCGEQMPTGASNELGPESGDP